MRIDFEVVGPPQGKERAGERIITPKGGRPFVQHYRPPKTAVYEDSIGWAARAAMRGRPPFPGAVRLSLLILMPIAPSWTKRDQAAAVAGTKFPTTKPDGDNVEKAVCDALNGVAWVDDVQVVEVARIKRYDLRPRLVVTVEELEVPDLLAAAA